MTKLCAAIFVDQPDEALRQTALAAEHGADIVELRLDRCPGAEAAREVVARSSLPCIATCRPKWEGGHCALPETQRLELLRAAADAGAAYVDIELEALRRGAPMPRGQAGVIISAHDFAGRPARLHNILLDMENAGGSVHKVAWMARSVRDNIEAFEILRQRRRPTIALCMGEAGVISRVLARKFGAFLTYAATDESGGTAPGQISLSEIKRLYRWDAVRPDTRVFGVVACPVGHSMSPAIHNAAFDAAGFNGIYVPLLVEPGYESFKAFMEDFLGFADLHLGGLSVTIPHKENALRYLEEKGAEIDPLARTIGAVNTIVIHRDGQNLRLRGLNTDYGAILDCLTSALGIDRAALEGLKVAVLGAGGTGRTAVAALAHYGADVIVYNRSEERARSLAAEFNGRSGRVRCASLAEVVTSGATVFINATSVGMYPDAQRSPLGDMCLPCSPGTVVFDVVYNPPVTLLLKQAQAAGAKTISGVEMFVRQAAAQFTAWTQLPAPTAVMRRVVHERLEVE